MSVSLACTLRVRAYFYRDRLVLNGNARDGKDGKEQRRRVAERQWRRTSKQDRESQGKREVKLRQCVKGEDGTAVLVSWRSGVAHAVISGQATREAGFGEATHVYMRRLGMVVWQS